MDKKHLGQVLEDNLARQLHWISSADSKAAFIFSLNAAMLGLLATAAPAYPTSWTIAPAIATAFCVASAFASLVFLSLATFPKTDGPKGSMLYCGGIAQRDLAEYAELMNGVSLDIYINDLTSQCHRNAVIANEKFKWIQRAMVSLYLGITPWALSIWLLYSAATKL